MASHAAARRAVGAGYKNVAVMSDGIVGWFALHQPIQHVSDSEAEGKSS
jgi:rhodanese-related sulfurtransferase